MSTLAIIGAGSGLGLATARRFAREGYAVAVIARRTSAVEDLVSRLRADSHTAAGFVADARDTSALTTALDRAAAELGPIDVLQYSPVPDREFMKPVLQTAVADLVGPVEMSLYGPVTAVRQVLPAMQAAGRGTVLFVNGASAVRPKDAVTGTSIAFAAESAYAQLLHEALAPQGIHVAQLIIPFGIGDGAAAHTPEALADRLWTLHVEKDGFRTFAEPLVD